MFVLAWFQYCLRIVNANFAGRNTSTSSLQEWLSLSTEIHVGEQPGHGFVVIGRVQKLDHFAVRRRSVCNPAPPSGNSGGSYRQIDRHENREDSAGSPPALALHFGKQPGEQRKNKPRKSDPQNAPDQRHLQADPAAQIQKMSAVIPGHRAEAKLLEKACEILRRSACG